jgi:tetrahedral aminopeptidase
MPAGPSASHRDLIAALAQAVAPELEATLETEELLRLLSEASGVSGYEMPVRDVVVEQFRRVTDKVSVDALGNVIAVKEGASTRQPRPRLMLAAHMDEIGLIVAMLDKGFIRFATVGGFDARVLPGQQVIVHGKRPLPGVVGAPPPHVTSAEERHKVIDLHDLFVDVGLSEAELSEVAQVGDIITIEREARTLAGGEITGKAFDDRAGVASVLRAFDILATQQHAWDVVGVATTQEEVGLYGAETSGYGVMPDAAIAIDVTFAAMPGIDPADTVSIGKGPSVAFGPNIHPLIFERIIAAAKEAEIPYQVEAAPGPSGTDAWAIQMVRGGVPTGLLGIPLKYMHTSVETVSKLDVERTARLLASVATSLKDGFVDELVPSV